MLETSHDARLTAGGPIGPSRLTTAMYVASSTQSADGNLAPALASATRVEDINAGAFFTNTILLSSLVSVVAKQGVRSPSGGDRDQEFDFATYLAPLRPDGEVRLDASRGNLRDLPWE